MGLEFLSVNDEADGAKLFLVHDGTHRQEQRLEAIKHEVNEACPHEVFVLSTREPDGQKIKDFYSIYQLPAVLIIRDDDELAYTWMGGQIPMTEQIINLLEQISG